MFPGSDRRRRWRRRRDASLPNVCSSHRQAKLHTKRTKEIWIKHAAKKIESGKKKWKKFIKNRGKKLIYHSVRACERVFYLELSWPLGEGEGKLIRRWWNRISAERSLSHSLSYLLTLSRSPSLSLLSGLLRMQIAMIPFQFKQYRGSPRSCSWSCSRPLATHVLCLRFFYINRGIKKKLIKPLPYVCVFLADFSSFL